MRILVLGGTGLTGPYAVRRLNGLGHQVTVFHRGTHAATLPEGVAEVRGDFADPPAALVRASYDVVVHMWAMGEHDAAAFLDRFAGRTGRAIVISSGDVYRAYGRLKRLEAGPADATPLTEDAPLRESRYPYGGTDYEKVLMEQVLRSQSRVPVTILRFPAVYGVNDNHRMEPWVNRMGSEHSELKLEESLAHWRWTHGYAEDVAEAVVLAATSEHAPGRTYNVGEQPTPDWVERLEQWARAAGWNGRIRLVPDGEAPAFPGPRLDFSHHIDLDTTRIRGEIGYREIVAPDEAIARTIAWERSAAAGES